MPSEQFKATSSSRAPSSFSMPVTEKTPGRALTSQEEINFRSAFALLDDWRRLLEGVIDAQALPGGKAQTKNISRKIQAILKLHNSLRDGKGHQEIIHQLGSAIDQLVASLQSLQNIAPVASPETRKMISIANSLKALQSKL